MKNLVILALFLVNLFSHEIINGDVLILKFDKKSVKSAFLDKKKINLILNPQNDSEFIAILPANYCQKDDLNLKITMIWGEENEVVHLKQGEYKKEVLSVEPAKVNPPKSVQSRIKKEYDEAVAIYAKTTPKYLFNEPFIVPLDSKITSNFGNGRIFNGSVKSYHSGTDFRAAVGTEIIAANDGVVKIAKDRYYAGGSVIIDHGGGIYSQYYHLDKILVKVGDSVKRGDLIGLSGATGRVSGPHLHFGIAINGTSVNPINFVEKINRAIFEE
ncbi:MAG: M23 family metallopeptidase [Campylobacter sp.]|nr:M23 family metallopeptidase [Campylobacter sp.]